MDKRIILAVAGSGKTSLIVNKLSSEKRSLVITYTENNFKNLKRKIISEFGFFPKGIQLYTYFSFLYRFCYRPFLLNEFPARGIWWETPPNYTMRLKRTDPRYYINPAAKLYHNRIAKLLETKDIYPLLNERLEKYFENIFVDEVQDFAGHDFNLLMNICKANTDIALVGDYFQHTFDTSRDGAVNKNLYENASKYISNFVKSGIQVDSETLSHSYRCSPTLCDFVTKEIGISIASHREDKTCITFIEDIDLLEDKFHCEKTVKLFYQNHHQYL